MSHDPIRVAIEKAGSVSALARMVGVRPQAISQWKEIPASRARTIADATGIPLHELRPDLWEPPRPEQGAAA